MRILSNSAKFSGGEHLLVANNFSATMASTTNTYRLGAVVSLKFSATEKGHSNPPTFRPMSIMVKWLDGPGYHLVRR